MTEKGSNGAIVMLVARVNIISKTLSFFYKNWNNKFRYPIYIHTFGKIIDDNLKKHINKNIDKNIYFIEINPKIPKNIDEKDLYYNRTYHDYVKRAFTKKRLGFLHMCHFLTNINSYGNIGCIGKELKKYDSLMFFDDDIYFKKKIDYDLFKYLEKYPAVTGFTSKLKRNHNAFAVTENLWDFFKSYIIKNNISPKDKNIKESLSDKDDKIINKLDWSCGSFDIYDIKKLESKNWSEYLNEINSYGGVYKFRWNNGYTINLFLRTHFDEPLYNLNFLEKGVIDTKIEGSDEFIYHGYKNYYNSKIFRFFLDLKKKLINLKN